MIRAYRYLWWNIRVWLCDVGSRIFGHGVDWCRIHGQQPVPDVRWIERIFWHPVEPKR